MPAERIDVEYLSTSGAGFRRPGPDRSALVRRLGLVVAAVAVPLLVAAIGWALLTHPHPASTAPNQPSSSATTQSPPTRGTSGSLPPSGQVSAGTGTWYVTAGSLKRDLANALNCAVAAGEQVWVCDGSTNGEAAMAYWANPHGIVFGDPAHGDHRYLQAPGTNGVAYPSEVWRAMAPYVVDKQTGDTITRWLQDHNRGSTVINGVTVSIDGPIASVEQGTAQQATANPSTAHTGTRPNWHVTDADLRRDLPKALHCTLFHGEGARICSGSIDGQAAAADWPDPSAGVPASRYVVAVVFGDPRADGEGYAVATGTSGVAYPSEVWRTIAPYLVPRKTADKITTWLQDHNSGRTTIDGLAVFIDGPIASVHPHR